MAYVELHACSAFSFLRGGSFPEHIAEAAADRGMAAAALLDRNGVYGSQRFSVAAREKNVRPIVGCELTMEDGSVLPVLVKTRAGYANLCSLLTQAHLRSAVKGECAVQWKELPEFAEGLVVLLGSARFQRAGDRILRSRTLKSSRRQNVVTSTLKACAPQTPAGYAQRLIDSLGQKNVYVELQRHFLRGEEQQNRALLDLAEQFRLPIIATNGVQYATAQGREVLDVFTCIREHTHLDAAGKLLAQNAERHLKSDREMRALFRDLPEAITNTERLAERLEFSLENIGYAFPDFPVPAGHDMNSFLRTITWFGAQQRYEAVSVKVRRQIEEELALITRLGFSGYFLIV
ncbi:MAG: PHP domain-containing protein, partial [Verrucomicrobiota bacterium]|nr:PHP domain-containing protein [Verrucomicrobiota bacterium]